MIGETLIHLSMRLHDANSFKTGCENYIPRIKRSFGFAPRSRIEATDHHVGKTHSHSEQVCEDKRGILFVEFHQLPSDCVIQDHHLATFFLENGVAGLVAKASPINAARIIFGFDHPEYITYYSGENPFEVTFSNEGETMFALSYTGAQ